MANIDLLGSTTRVEFPYIKVTIGDYTFGVYTRTSKEDKLSTGFYSAINVTYPNYIKSLSINKVNGTVNKYTLNMFYVITPQDDPNFFEKVFSSISETRKITFTYGDMNLPTFIYKSEEAMLTSYDSTFDIKNSIINYTLEAVSTGNLATSGSYTVGRQGLCKPSDEIKRLLNDTSTGLKDVFYGMNHITSQQLNNLIASDDKMVNVPIKTNMSALEALNYLVSCMVPVGSSTNFSNTDVYALTLHDDTSGTYSGPYFKVTRVSSKIEKSDAYEINIGCFSADVIMRFQLKDQNNYALLYNWQEKLNPNVYVERIDNEGNYIKEYSPTITTTGSKRTTSVEEQNWWTKVTQFPKSGTITIKGLLRPAILMTHVRINVYFFGRKHISSGLYIVTNQQDQIDASGYRTTLSITRISGDEQLAA